MITKYELKNGQTRYKSKIYLGIDDATGKVVAPMKSGFKKYSDAVKYETDLKNNFLDNGNSLTKSLKKYTFKDVFKLWFMQYKLSVKENTYITAMQVAEKHILPVFGEFFLSKIPLVLCQEATNLWYETYSKASFLVNLTKRILDFAISIECCAVNPMTKIMRPKNTHKKKYESPFFEKEQLIEFERIISESEDIMVRTMFRVLAFTGLRKSELLALQWADLDEVNRTLSVKRIVARGISSLIVQDPKTESSFRTISIDSRTWEILKQWRTVQKVRLIKHGQNTNRKNQYVFTNENNSFLNHKFLNNNLKRILANHPNLPKMTIHGFRHTHCSLLFDARVEEGAIKERLGHSSILTTRNIYDHVTKHRSEDTAQKFENFISF
ncbi:tyrosine-type recombinase/integrase [Fundicoccus sp. Sow4_F4]|uniref:tyrosine-type recombinase/integrase n=1 Tax=Fundicoccus sp. Sow4_F4 TaxID=3438783 RepID=UPI003F90FD75